MTYQELADRITEGEQSSLRRANLSCEVNMVNAIARVKPGRKWTKIDVGYSGRYMIDPDGNIYGIKAYGVPHYGHQYGTLDNPSAELFAGRYR